uniref:NADH dehydrogenase subunit 4L n=1 Tax=Notodoris gardineri TaxID=407123 RepID=E6Y197_NOTGA|nr:NADH dehydrogenase subunit 4L [Notodoris gardineri]ABL09050.1 NADH dehydrogenase subunit 4L [Notodoris gardineri]
MKVSWAGVVSSTLCFSKMNSHILSLLISLEALMLSLFWFY